MGNGIAPICSVVHEAHPSAEVCHAPAMPTATSFPTRKATAEQVQAWLYASGFDAAKLAGMDGRAIYAMSEEDLNALTDEGTAIYIAVHRIHPIHIPEPA